MSCSNIVQPFVKTSAMDSAGSQQETSSHPAEESNGAAELPSPPAVEADDDAHDCSGEASSSELAPEFGHRWTLEQFSKYLPGEKVLSDAFIFNGQQWRIMAFPRGNNGNTTGQCDGDCFSLFLEFNEVATNTNAEAAVKTKLSVLRDGVEAITKSFCRGFSMKSQHRDWGFKKMCLVAELQAEGYLVNDCLEIELGLWELKGAALEQATKTRQTTINKEFIIDSIAGNNVAASLDLSGQSLCPEFAVSLGEALHTNTSISTLNLSSNRIGPKGTTAIMAALLNNSTITELRLRGNHLGPAGAMQLAQALVTNPTLSSLHIGANQLGPKGGTMLGGMLACNSALTTLSAESNQLGDQGVTAVLKGLAANKSLTILDLCDNELNEQIGVQLRQAIEGSKSLRHLGLAKNELFEGARQVLQALQCPTVTLNTLDVSCCGLGEASSEVLAETLLARSCLSDLNIAGNQLGLEGSSSVMRALCNNTWLTSLNMNNNAMGSDIAATIKKTLKLNQTLQKLHLAWNDLGHLGGTAVAKGVKVNTSLVHLDLSHNSLGSTSGAALEQVCVQQLAGLTVWLVQALLANTTLLSLCLRGNQLESKAGTAILHALGKPGYHLSLLNNTLKVLDLSDNNLGKAAGAAVRGLLVTNSSLVSLNLSCNNIGAAGAQCWEEDHLPVTAFQALEANQTLTHLNISGNNLGADGDKAVYGLLKYSMALQELTVGCNEFGQDATLGILHALMATLHSDVLIKDLEDDIELLEPSDLKLFGLPQQQAPDVVMEHIYYKRRKAQQAAQEASEQHAEQQLRALQEADKIADQQATQLLQELEAEEETAVAAKKRRRDKKKKQKKKKGASKSKDDGKEEEEDLDGKEEEPETIDKAIDTGEGEALSVHQTEETLPVGGDDDEPAASSPFDEPAASSPFDESAASSPLETPCEVSEEAADLGTDAAAAAELSVESVEEQVDEDCADESAGCAAEPPSGSHETDCGGHECTADDGSVEEEFLPDPGDSDSASADKSKVESSWANVACSEGEEKPSAVPQNASQNGWNSSLNLDESGSAAGSTYSQMSTEQPGSELSASSAAFRPTGGDGGPWGAPSLSVESLPEFAAAAHAAEQRGARNVHRSASWANIAKSQEPEEGLDDEAQNEHDARSDGDARIHYLEQHRAEQEEKNRSLQARLNSQEARGSHELASKDQQIEEMEAKAAKLEAENRDLTVQAERAKEMERTVLQMAAKITQMERAGGQLLQEKQNLLIQLDQLQGKQLSPLNDSQLEHRMKGAVDAVQEERTERRIESRARELTQMMIAQQMKNVAVHGEPNGNRVQPNGNVAITSDDAQSIEPNSMFGRDMFGGELVEEMFWDSSWDAS